MDHYKTLGVSKNATAEEIKRAYRKLASTTHPDKGGDTSSFQAIQTAYDTLGDVGKRQAYDNPQSGFREFPGGFQFSNGGNPFDINDLFRQAFGQRPQHGRTAQQLYRANVFVTLEEVYSGATRTLKIKTAAEEKTLDIVVPKGIATGAQLKYNEVIDNGILVVEFVVEPHLKFDRRHADLYANHSISVLDLIVGTSFEFKTISGKTIAVTVPAKTQPNMQLKLTGQGLPIPGTSFFGDQIVLLKPYLPDHISTEITSAIISSRDK